RVSGESKTEQREGDSRETERREVAMRSIILILAVMSLGLGSPTKVIFTLVIVLFVLSYPIKTSDQKDIECIYIYKQLAFSHELLQNHKLQKSKWKTSETQVSKANCPEGMIPMDQSSRHEV
ncbi:hypothetical protein HID58_063421, partial [Brassica napus]